MKKDLHINSPLIESIKMGQIVNSRVWLKMDCLQPSGSFKLRGIGNACKKYIDRGAKEFISSSGGNAGMAVAYSGRLLNTPVTVVVPETTKKIAINMIQREGANVIVHGNNWNAAHDHAKSLVTDQNKYIHPFDDAFLWEGYAEIIDEILEEDIVPDTVVLSVGGGGLLCGISEGLKKNNLDKTSILAIETEGADSLHNSYTQNRHVSIDSIDSIATSLGTKKVAQHAFEISKEKNVFCKLVTDKDAIKSVDLFLNDHRILVEPACGASLASIYNNSNFFKDKKNIVVIICGGVGITLKQLNLWKKEYL
tara:strand:+ start:89 stop:1015 length:927 start_codon:yes stop_codon:yes gene_type:complete